MKKNGLLAVLTMTLSLMGCAGSQFPSAQNELKTTSDQTVDQKRAMNHLNLAVGYYEQGQWASALDDIKKALQSDPNLADAYGVRALIYMEMNEPGLADENFLHALSISPGNPDFSNNYGWFLCQNGRAAQAIPYFETAIKGRNYQSPAKAFNNAGVCSLKLKNESAAEQYFSKAFKLEPGNPVTNANLAKIYFDRKDYERARFYISRVPQSDELNADVLWLAIKVHHKLGDRDAETSLVTQLRKRHLNSPEYAAFKRGAFDE
ncbi:MAG: type IV pilus biogenesis/stability protein PilW [Burkholderiaceae bacterium]